MDDATFPLGGEEAQELCPYTQSKYLYNSHRKPEKKSEEKMFLEVTLFFQEELSTFVFQGFF